MQKMILALFGSALLLCLLLVIVFGDKGLVDLNHAKGRRDALRSKNGQIAAGNLRLSHEIHRLRNDPAYVEHVARQDLGMIGPGEIVLRFAPEAGEEVSGKK
ncbi:MAG: septum formation initiator family protein [Desulfobacterales bacterium]|nr:septum formation initiator family protein [Desulfobacterales bacterium]